MRKAARLLRLPPSSRYALSAALCLATLPQDAYHLADEISGLTGLSAGYLSKILQRLARRGLLDSRRGANGGYRLGRPAEEITAAEVVAASGPDETGAAPCMLEARSCDCSAPCALHRFAARAEGATRRRLDRTTLGDMAATLRRHSGQGGSGDDIGT